MDVIFDFPQNAASRWSHFFAVRVIRIEIILHAEFIGFLFVHDLHITYLLELVIVQGVRPFFAELLQYFQKHVLSSGFLFLPGGVDFSGFKVSFALKVLERMGFPNLP